MTTLSDKLIEFDTLGELNEYCLHKYASHYVLPEDTPFKKENDYRILAVRVIKEKDSNTVTIEAPANSNIFKSHYKSFLMVPLNSNREYLVDKISNICMDDDIISIVFEEINFNSFEFGLLIDTKFKERGYQTLSTYINIFNP